MVALVRTPGTVLAGNFAAASRGGHVFNGLQYHVSANHLYSFDGANTSASLGTLASNSGTVYMADNGLSPVGGNQLIIVDGTNGYVYNVSPQPTVTITGDGNGASANATVSANGVITALNIISQGNGYTNANVKVFCQSGSGAVANAVLSGGTLTNIVVTSGGTGYILPPTISFSGGNGSNAAAIVNPNQIVNGQITGIQITNVGSNYTSAPAVSFTPVLGGSGVSATATVSGSNITSITVSNGGSGYSVPVFAQLSSNGGSNAAANAVLGPGTVSAITVNSNAYVGYSVAPSISLTGGNGTGALVQAVLATGSNATATSTLSGNGVNAVTVTNIGSNYTVPPTISFYGGNGTGATATATISGTVSAVNITSGGKYYIYDKPSVQFIGGGGSGATAHVVMGSADAFYNAPVASVVIDNGGSNYISAPAVQFVGGKQLYITSTSPPGYFLNPPIVATGYATLAAGVSSIAVTAAGANYTSAPNVLILNPITSIGVSSGGSGYTSAPTASVTGVISAINITSGGGGYGSAPTVVIAGGGGSGATAHATLSGNAVGNIIIDNVGSGYTSAANVTFSSGNATATSNISQALATANISNPVAYITVTNPGSLYSSPPSVVITDPTGSGASALAQIYNGMVVAIVLTSAGANYTSPTVSFTANTGIGWPSVGAQSVCFINGVFAIGEGGGSSEFMVSDLYDGMLWNPLNTAAKSIAADPLISVFNNLGWLFLFGNTTSEIWTNTGVGTPPFAWSSSYDFGLAAQASVAKGDNTVFWLGTQKNNDGGELIGIVKGTLGAAKIISPPWINYQITQMTTVSDAIGYCYTDEGHTFYVITFPTGNATYVYDASMPPGFEWHERSAWTGSLYTTQRHVGNYYTYFGNKHYITDYSNGNIYKFSSSNYTDNGTAIGRLAISNPVFDPESLHNLFHSKVQIDAMLGAANGTLHLTWSNDGGNTWSTDHAANLTAGDYLSRIVYNALGYARSRIYRIATSDAISIILIDAYVEAEKGNS